MALLVTESESKPWLAGTRTYSCNNNNNNNNSIMPPSLLLLYIFIHSNRVLDGVHRWCYFTTRVKLEKWSTLVMLTAVAVVKLLWQINVLCCAVNMKYSILQLCAELWGWASPPHHRPCCALPPRSPLSALARSQPTQYPPSPPPRHYSSQLLGYLQQLEPVILEQEPGPTDEQTDCIARASHWKPEPLDQTLPAPTHSQNF